METTTSITSKLENNNSIDVVLGRVQLALARRQQLVALSLSPITAEELQAAKSDNDRQREEDELFTPVPEKYVHLAVFYPPIVRDRNTSKKDKGKQTIN
jgi:Protein of unknown function (DUF3245)